MYYFIILCAALGFMLGGLYGAALGLVLGCICEIVSAMTS